MISASDGYLSDEAEIEIEVLNKNQKPVCEDIPNLEWKEDETTSLNLTEY